MNAEYVIRIKIDYCSLQIVGSTVLKQGSTWRNGQSCGRAQATRFQVPSENWFFSVNYDQIEVFIFKMMIYIISVLIL